MVLKFHPSATISPLADIEDSRRGTLISIGADSVIDSFVKIKPAGGTGDVVIGERVNINSGCVIYTGNGVAIGNDVLIAANCVLAPVDHEFADRNRPIRQQRFRPSRGGIVIEDDVWVGAGAILLDGAILRRGCVIGAGSLVRGEIAAYSVAAGRPAKVIGERG
jgi:acetyltransferase-like isoleucine patch superfamily enzyme